MKLDADFIDDHDCVGRRCMPRVQRLFVDLVCRLIGHQLWRVMGSVRTDVESLPLFATYCRRCYRGGYVRSDFYR